MKRTLAIFLIFIHLLGSIGCFGVFSGLEIIHKDQFLSSLDEDAYTGSDAITLRIPYTLPYPSNQNNYERVDGKFNYDGAMYRLVKQKLYNDTLYVICVRDKEGTRIENAFGELASSFTDAPADTQSSSKSGNLFVKEFEYSAILHVNSEKTAQKILRPFFVSPVYTFRLINSIDRPPQV